MESQTNVKSKYFKRVCPDLSLLLFSPILRLFAADYFYFDSAVVSDDSRIS